jgi:hypothetical protein
MTVERLARDLLTHILYNEEDTFYSTELQVFFNDKIIMVDI